MAGDEGQRRPFPAPVLEKLAGQFDGIPGHAIYTRDRADGLPGQHVVQPVPEFVKKRG